EADRVNSVNAVFRALCPTSLNISRQGRIYLDQKVQTGELRPDNSGNRKRQDRSYAPTMGPRVFQYEGTVHLLIAAQFVRTGRLTTTRISEMLAPVDGYSSDSSIMIITQEMFETFLRCPTKSYLSCHGPTATASELTKSRKQLQDLFLRNGVSRIFEAIPASGLFVGTPAASTIRQ